MTARERLPNRRRALTRSFELNNLKYSVTFGWYPDGRLGEIFIQNTKPASASDSYSRDSAIAASLALQFGCPVDVLRRAVLRDSQGRPSTPLGVALDLVAEQGRKA